VTHRCDFSVKILNSQTMAVLHLDEFSDVPLPSVGFVGLIVHPQISHNLLGASYSFSDFQVMHAAEPTMYLIQADIYLPSSVELGRAVSQTTVARSLFFSVYLVARKLWVTFMNTFEGFTFELLNKQITKIILRHDLTRGLLYE
jgi:hypothetical protein